jgi:hypothetical protein
VSLDEFPTGVATAMRAHIELVRDAYGIYAVSV